MCSESPGTTVTSAGPAKILIGGQGFSPPDWVGSFYPPGFPAARFLPFYAQVFDTVELNTTFYAIPSASTICAWRERVPDHFVFSAKMPRAVTHDKQLLDIEADVNSFIERIKVLGDKLGAIVIQFPASFTRRHQDRLSAFLPLLPHDLRFAIEFRSSTWDHPDVFDLLRQANVAWCTTHWQDLPPVVQITADFAYFRLVGFHDEFSRLDRVQHDRSQELAFWARTVSELSGRLSRIYLYVNNHYEGHSPATLNRLKRLLGVQRIDPQDLWPEHQRQLPGMPATREPLRS